MGKDQDMKSLIISSLLAVLYAEVPLLLKQKRFIMPQLPNLQEGSSSLAYDFKKRTPLMVENEDFDKRSDDVLGATGFGKRGEAADRLRNILNKYKQGSNSATASNARDIPAFIGKT